MGKLTTHVLDTMNGGPAAGLTLTFWRLPHDGLAPEKVLDLVLNEDGRAPGPLMEGADMRPGRYRLVFEVGAYFRARGVRLPEPAFLESVPIDFGVADADSHYHVPLLVSPWSYSTYRGS